MSPQPSSFAQLCSQLSPSSSRRERAPAITGATGAASVTVTGLNFGFSDYTSTSVVSRGTCATTMWSSSTSVGCLTAALPGRDRHIEITIAGRVGTGLDIFSFDAPVLSQALSNVPHSGGASLTLVGLSFAYDDHTMTAMASVALCHTTVWSTASQARPTHACTHVHWYPHARMKHTHLQVQCLTPTLGFRPSSLSLTVGAVVGTGQDLLSFDAPMISAALLNSPTSVCRIVVQLACAYTCVYTCLWKCVYTCV